MTIFRAVAPRHHDLARQFRQSIDAQSSQNQRYNCPGEPVFETSRLRIADWEPHARSTRPSERLAPAVRGRSAEQRARNFVRHWAKLCTVWLNIVWSNMRSHRVSRDPPCMIPFVPNRLKAWDDRLGVATPRRSGGRDRSPSGLAPWMSRIRPSFDAWPEQMMGSESRMQGKAPSQQSVRTQVYLEIVVESEARRLYPSARQNAAAQRQRRSETAQEGRYRQGWPHGFEATGIYACSSIFQTAGSGSPWSIRPARASSPTPSARSPKRMRSSRGLPIVIERIRSGVARDILNSFMRSAGAPRRWKTGTRSQQDRSRGRPPR